MLRHWPYVESLPAPEQLRTPLYFTDDELRLLEGTNLLGAAQDRRKQWEEESGVVRDALKEVELTRWVRLVVLSDHPAGQTNSCLQSSKTLGFD